MATVTVYGLKKCSTCVKALAWLDQHGIAYQFVDYREHPLAADSLVAWASQLGGWPKLLNRASMTWRQLPDDLKQPETDQQWLALVADYPALVRRPLVVRADGSASVGFSDKKLADLLG